jgi:hypothetical protein
MNKYAGEVLRAARSFRDEGVDAAVQRTYELHCRYGREIRKVIDDAIRNYAPNIREHTLASGCLLRAVIADHKCEVERTAPESPFPSEKPRQDDRDFAHPTRIELAIDVARRQLVIDGLGHVGTLAHFALLSELADQYRADRAAGLKPDNHRFVRKETLLDLLGANNEMALRQRISEFRKRVVELADEVWGLSLGRDAVIENKFGAGYRLNPAVVLIDSAEIGQAPTHK